MAVLMNVTYERAHSNLRDLWILEMGAVPFPKHFRQKIYYNDNFVNVHDSIGKKFQYVILVMSKHVQHRVCYKSN